MLTLEAPSFTFNVIMSGRDQVPGKYACGSCLMRSWQQHYMCVLGGRVSEIAKPMKEMCHMQLCFKDTPATDWAQLFPDASRDAMDLLSQLGQWNPGQCPEVLHSAWEQNLLHQVRVQTHEGLLS